MLTDRGTEYFGIRDQHEYQLYLAVEDIDHSKTKVLKQMEFVNDFIAPSKMNFMQYLFVKNFTEL